jgi:hypothetical protein
MKITGCRVNYGPVKELFGVLPRAIIRVITGEKESREDSRPLFFNESDLSDINEKILKDVNFDFKLEVTLRGRKTSLIKSYGPGLIGHPDFEILKNKTLPVIGNRDIVAFGIKFNEDGTITVVSTEEIPSNEGALPRQSTVDQLNKIRRATKSTTIDDTTPKMKGANLGYEGSTVDRGIESYEDFEKKNKSFISGWNLKHLKSPFKTKIK